MAKTTPPEQLRLEDEPEYAKALAENNRLATREIELRSEEEQLLAEVGPRSAGVTGETMEALRLLEHVPDDLRREYEARIRLQEVRKEMRVVAAARELSAPNLHATRSAAIAVIQRAAKPHRRALMATLAAKLREAVAAYEADAAYRSTFEQQGVWVGQPAGNVERLKFYAEEAEREASDES